MLLYISTPSIIHLPIISANMKIILMMVSDYSRNARLTYYLMKWQSSRFATSMLVSLKPIMIM